MNGHVFQLFSEHKTRSQFQETIGQLKIYAATSYKDQVKHLQILFDELEEPKATKPKYPQVTTDDNGKSLEPDAGDLAIYTEEVKEFVKTKRTLENTVHSLYCVVWGQCSPLMQHKLRSVTELQSNQHRVCCPSTLTKHPEN